MLTRLRTKILLGYAIPSLFTMLTALIIYQALTLSLNTAEQETATISSINLLNSLIKAAVNMETGVRGFLITGNEDFLEPYDAGVEEFNQILPQLKPLLSPTQVAQVEQIEVLHGRWLRQVAEPEIALQRAGNTESAFDLVRSGHGKQLLDEMRTIGGQLIREQSAARDERFAASRRASRYARLFAILTPLVAGGLALAIGVLLARSISQRVGRVVTAAQFLSAGELEQRVPVMGNDEITVLGTAFNEMAERLQRMVEAERETQAQLHASAAQLQAKIEMERAMQEQLQDAVEHYLNFASRVAQGDLSVRLRTSAAEELSELSENLNTMVQGLGDLSQKIREGAHSISAATAQILASGRQYTASANQQSAALAETSATIDEMRATTEQSALKATEVAHLSRASVEVSQEGMQAIETLLVGMQAIRDKVEVIAEDILALSEQTQQIGEITATVNDIADQSNLLALNATIEAARAGEHGRGFAVVAAEVRNLAEQSKQATAKVRGILNDIQKATNEAVLATEQGSKEVEAGTRQAQRSGRIISQLTDTIREASQAAQQIAASSNQQSVGMDQIAEAMKEITQATEQFVIGAEQSREASESLNDLARQLHTMTEQYKTQ